MKTFAKFTLFIGAVILLTACGTKKWQVEVELAPNERRNIERAITDWEHQIERFEIGPDGEIAWREITQLAKSYEKIGRLDKAIELYKSWLKRDNDKQVFVHNLGRLYEDVKEYDLAIAQYQRLVDEYRESNYHYDITWAYIRAKDRKAAEKAFNKWQLAFNKTDEQTQEAIKKLRAEEKANQSDN